MTHFIKKTTQNVTDQSTVSTDLITDIPPITTDQSSLTAAVTSESNSWNQVNSSVTSATAKPNATFADVITAQATAGTTESITNPSGESKYVECYKVMTRLL